MENVFQTISREEHTNILPEPVEGLNTSSGLLTQHTKQTEQAKGEVVHLGQQTQPEVAAPLVVGKITSESQQITKHNTKLKSSQQQVFWTKKEKCLCIKQS